MKLLEDLYRISSPSGKEQEMARYITAWLDMNGIAYSMDKVGNIYAVKGDYGRTFPCLVCHIDEVHPAKGGCFETVIFRDEIIFGYDNLKKCFKGVGADDKNGIWICLKCLEMSPLLKCVFFTGEELGCRGSYGCDLAFFDDCRFVVECDRRGREDMVTSIAGTPLCSGKFIRDCDPKLHGYYCTTGMATDVYALKKRGLPLSCANLSCGYYNPHSDEEYTKIGDLLNCLRFVQGILGRCTRVYPHRHIPKGRGHARRYLFFPGDDREYYWTGDDLYYPADDG